MVILVTGSLGYIGKSLVWQLLGQGHTVIGIDIHRFHDYFQHPHYIGIQADIANREMLANLFKKYQISVLIHLAAYIDAAQSMQQPGIYFCNNALSMIPLLDLAAQHSIHKCIYISSAAVYGNAAQIPIKETNLLAPINPYGESKVIAERLLKWYADLYNIDTVILRCFNIQGADIRNNHGKKSQQGSDLVSCIVQAVKKNQPLAIYGKSFETADGTTVRDYVHLLDVVQSIVQATQKKLPGYQVINVGSGQGTSTLQVVKYAEEIVGKKIVIDWQPPVSGNIALSVGDIDLLRKKLLPHYPMHSINQILEDALVYEQIL